MKTKCGYLFASLWLKQKLQNASSWRVFFFYFVLLIARNNFLLVII